MRSILNLPADAFWRYRDHLRALPAEDRRLRFGYLIDDAGIDRFVAGLDRNAVAIYGVEDADNRLVAAVLIANVGGDGAELAFSVLPSHRRQGHARALFKRALLALRNRRIGTVHLACRTENQAMRHLARSQGMAFSVSAGEAEASLALPPPSAVSVWQEFACDAAAARRRAVRRAWAPALAAMRPAAVG